MGRNKLLEIGLPQPCHEDWDKMQANDCGRFCMLCSKTVIDFTAATDEELISFFAKKPEHICGRFRDDQLNRKIPFREAKEHSLARTQLSRIAASLLLIQASAAGLQAQEKQTPQQVVLKGSVRDYLSGRPLTGMTISVEGLNYQKYSDKNGDFTFVLPATYAGKTVTVQADYQASSSPEEPGFKIKEAQVQLSTDGQAATVQLQRYPFEEFNAMIISSPGYGILARTGEFHHKVTNSDENTITVKESFWYRVKKVFKKKKQ